MSTNTSPRASMFSKERWFGTKWNLVDLIVGGIFFTLLIILPVVENIARGVFQTTALLSQYVQQIVVILTFYGAAMATRADRHLAINLGFTDGKSTRAELLGWVLKFFSIFTSSVFLWASFHFVLFAFFPGDTIGVFPVQLFVVFIPLGFIMMLFRELRSLGREKLTISIFVGIFAVLLGTYVALPTVSSTIQEVTQDYMFSFGPLEESWYSVIPSLAPVFVVLLVLSAFVGVPLFKVLGGMAALFFAGLGFGPTIVIDEGYRMLTDGGFYAAIPLFTFVGFLLTESKAAKRLVDLFHHLFRYLPGGAAIAAIVSMTVFTVFTGASGITILAVGGLLLTILAKSGDHNDSFSHGLLTSSASLGVIFPPSFGLILFGSLAQVSILDMFLGGILPTLLMVLGMVGIAVFAAIRHRRTAGPRAQQAESKNSDPNDAGTYWKKGFGLIRQSWAEALLPIIVLTLIFTTWADLPETSAYAVIFSLVVYGLVKKELSFKAVWSSLRQTLVVVGGVLIIFAAARGLSYYLIEENIPQQLALWFNQTINSPVIFLILVNVVLLIAGCFMDLYSAMSILAPLLLPLAESFGIDKVHFGIIFLSNLSVGFITPPVGMNLFLASYRFQRPLVKLYKDVLPFFAVQIVVVLLITYVPWFSTALIGGQ